MASIQSVKDLTTQLGLSLPDGQIESIARQCGDFDHERTLTALKLLDENKLNATKILAEIRKHQLQTRQTYCGFCSSTWIPILDQYAWTEAGRPEYQTWTHIPQTMIRCPNCDKSKAAVRTINSLSEELQGWAWVCLYAWISHYVAERNREQAPPIAPEVFNVRNYWPDLTFTPLLTATQRNLMEWIHKPEPVPIAHPTPRVHGFANPALVGAVLMGKKLMGAE